MIIVNEHYQMIQERAPERRRATRTYPLHFAITALGFFLVGMLFTLAVITPDAMVENARAFWMARIGG